MSVQIESRKYLADALNELMPRLYRAFSKDGRHVGFFLQGAIVTHADADTLEAIVRDVRQELDALEGRPTITEHEIR